MVITRSREGIKLASALSRDVLPELVPPLTSTLQRARTAISSNWAMPASKVPSFTKSTGVSGSLRNFRIETESPSIASGSMITLMRPPSGNRASTIGLASSSRRPSGARMRRTMRMTCSESAKRSVSRSSMPCRDT
ncbi:hypothetical protein D3C85_1543500 [compost metagenome]